MKFSFIFVLFHTPKKEIARLKNEVQKIGLEDYEIQLIDNTKKNLGYASALNKGIQNALNRNIDIVIVANTDISLKSLRANDFINVSKKFDVASFSMQQDKKTYFCGELDSNRLTSFLTLEKPLKKYLECKYITGSLMIIKSEVFSRTGLFNEKYFMYYEDVDFCMRAKLTGYTVGIASDKSYIHFEISKHNKEKDKLLFNSWIRFFIKYSNTQQKIRELIRLPKTIYKERSHITSNVNYLLTRLRNK